MASIVESFRFVCVVLIALISFSEISEVECQCTVKGCMNGDLEPAAMNAEEMRQLLLDIVLNPQQLCNRLRKGFETSVDQNQNLEGLAQKIHNLVEDGLKNQTQQLRNQLEAINRSLSENFRAQTQLLKNQVSSLQADFESHNQDFKGSCSGRANDESYVVLTPADKYAGRKYFELTASKNTFEFDVVACKEAVVSLSDGQRYLCEVVIGLESNTKSMIRSLVDNTTIYHQADTRDILHCLVKRSFWIQVENQQLTFGTGKINEIVILSANVPGLVVQKISIMTNNVQGKWTFTQQPGGFVETRTPNKYSYSFTWMTMDQRKAIVFKVKACNDAHIALSSQIALTSHHTYEIVLGGNENKLSFIRNLTLRSNMAQPSTPGILSCVEMRTFWLSWDSGLIRVGRGEVVGCNQLMSWQDPNPYSVRGLGISSGWGAEAIWQFTEFSDVQGICNPYLAPRDCAAIRADGRNTSGLYRIYAFDRPKSSSAEVFVFCDMDIRGNSWLVFQRRKDGSEDFYRTWNEYRDGFGNPNGEYWLGNEMLFLLTSKRNYKLRVELEDWNGEKKYAEYSTFSIGSSTDKYRLSVGGYSGNAGDSLSSHSGMKFSTKDNRNDNSTGTLGCATSFRGAWWFYNCYISHLNGIYHRGGNYSGQAETKDGISWNSWYGVGVFYSLKTTEMKISPVN